MREETVIIQKMAFGGSGIGRLNGKVCFVPFTAAGDTVKILLKNEKKSYCEGEVSEIVEPSPLRVVPPCPVFGRCGGCDWQHMEYSAQLEAKQGIFTEILSRNGKVEANRILPIIGAEEPYEYRSRVQLKMRSVRGEIYLGFFAQGSHSVVNIPSGCAISSPSINKTVEELRAVLAGFPEPEMLPQIDITSGDDGDVLIVFHYDGIDRDRICNFLHGQSNRLSLVRGIFLQSGRKNTILPVSGLESTSYSVSDKIFKGLHGMRLKTSRGGFSQVNYRQNSVLIDLVLQWIDPRGEERILDLYCGNGNFSLPVARYAAEVTGFEEYEQSIKDAEDNRLSNKLANAKFECIDSVKGLKRLTASDQNFPVVILDPPRSGAPKAVELIPLIKPLKIIYISCDPATLARDISKLREFDYLVTKSRPVDMFPQTYHIESVTLLERREP